MDVMPSERISFGAISARESLRPPLPFGLNLSAALADGGVPNVVSTL
jgi:hypothetical protein